MPANLPPEARAKYAKYLEARTVEEKIKALEEFISAVPKHKGTENLLYWARRKLADLREEAERKKRRGGGGPRLFIRKEGAAQIAVIGLANAGKSSIVQKLTGARTEVADYPVSTRMPQPGMLRYEDIQFQLVDLPPLIPGSSEWNRRVIGLARNADALIIVLSADSDLYNQYIAIKKMLEENGIHLSKPRGRVVIEKERGSGSAGLRVVLSGRIIDGTVDDVRRLLGNYRIYNGVVKIYGEVSLEDVEKAVFEHISYKPLLILVNKCDLPGSEDKLAEFIKKAKPTQPVIPVSARTGLNLDRIGDELFRQLEIIRVYTKQPNSEPSPTPLILKKGSSVMDVARAIHTRFVETFKYARVWGASAKYPGERVGLDHVLADKDIVEIHVKG